MASPLGRKTAEERSGRQLEETVKYQGQQLELLQRFVESHFGETFQDFAARNQVPEADDVEDPPSPPPAPPVQKELPVAKERVTRKDVPPRKIAGKRYSLRNKRKLSGAALLATVRNLRVCLRRVDDKSPGKVTTAPEAPPPEDNEGPAAVDLEPQNSSTGWDGDGTFFTFPAAAPSEVLELPETKKEEIPEGRRHRKPASFPFSKKQVTSPPPGHQTCEFCQRNVRNDLMMKHLQDFHCRERHLKCDFCDKRFFSQVRLQKHVLIHQLNKIGKRCRVTACRSKEMLFVDSYQALKHERFCIRRELNAGRPVDAGLMEDVWRRSRHRKVPLGWPGEEALVRGFAEKLKSEPGLTPEQIRNLVEFALLNEEGRWRCSVCEGEHKSVVTFGNKGHLTRHLTNVHGRINGGKEGIKRKEEEEDKGEEDEEELEEKNYGMALVKEEEDHEVEQISCPEEVANYEETA